MSKCGKPFLTARVLNSLKSPINHCNCIVTISLISSHLLLPFILFILVFTPSPVGQFSTGSASVVPSQSSHTLSTTLMPVTAETSTPTPTHTSLSISTHSSLKITSTTHISSTVQMPTITPPASDQRPTIGAKTTPVSYKNIPTSSDESPQPTVQDIDTSSAPPSVGSQGILLLTVFLLVVQELY